MVDQLRSWFRENHTLVIFLIAQAIAVGTAAAAILAYSVRLETRVSIMETRGAEYTVAQMEEMKQRITVLEQSQSANAARLERIVDIMTKGGQPK
jgi:ERCC4-type nuclease